VNPLPPLNHSCMQIPKRLQTHFLTKTSNFPFQQLRPCLTALVSFVRSSCSACRVIKGLFLPRGLFVVFPRGGLFLVLCEPFVVLVDSHVFRPPPVLRLFLPTLFCTTNSRFSFAPTPVPIPLLSCLLCDHTCLVLWCLYVVSPFT